MKLTAFRIRNYRAIVDTSWVNLSPDNITTLIGQNESGKTSVLEALYSFYTGTIHEDVLRSDLSLPYISCCFYADKSFLGTILDPCVIAPNIYENIVSSGKIYINRKWTDQNNSCIFFGDDHLIALHEEEKQKEKQNIAELEETVHIVLEENKKINTDKIKLENEKSELVKSISILKKKTSGLLRKAERTGIESKKQQYELERSNIISQYDEMNEKLLALEKKLDITKKRFNELTIASRYAESFLSTGRKYKASEHSLEVLQNELRKKSLELRFCTDDKRSHHLKHEIKEILLNINSISKELKNSKKSFQYATECLSIALSENIPDNIESIVGKSQEEKQRLLSPEDIGHILFKHIPAFKLFEDFSSLLPNRIDLDDILSSNTSVEGYNAVKNFLIVSGLDASFFTEQNNRILKQKIENLNGEITLNFQDYWRQSLGRKNKIKINFELEHYDFSHPVKKGKPYLEFWIKDEHERLYPKQRSRGVRWFLSFYLELKATSLKNSPVPDILLIDEPGLSLHARAQEDVLKVFEDLQNTIQIFYSTHSAHLVDISKLYRILAVQRADEDNDKSESLVFDAGSIGLASGDTLSPVYSLIGTNLSQSNFLQERNNIIVEDMHSFYYLKNIFNIFSKEKNIYFLPANGVANIPLLINMMIGWNLHYAVLLFNNEPSLKIYKEIKEKIFRNEQELTDKKVLIMKPVPGIEDLFSTIDFKKYILHKRVGITESNLEYIANNKISRNDLAAAFSLQCQIKDLKYQDFDEETRENLMNLTTGIINVINN